MEREREEIDREVVLERWMFTQLFTQLFTLSKCFAGVILELLCDSVFPAHLPGYFYSLGRR